MAAVHSGILQNIADQYNLIGPNNKIIKPNDIPLPAESPASPDPEPMVVTTPANIPTIRTDNRYACLESHPDSAPDVATPSTSSTIQPRPRSPVRRTATPTTTPTTTRTPRSAPPPLVLHNRPRSHRELINSISQTVKKEFYIKYVPDGVKIFVSDKQEYIALRDDFIAHGVLFHTYTLPENKPMAVVLKGLPGDQKEDIREALTEQGLPVKEIMVMKGDRIRSPLYKCNFEHSTSFNDISSVPYLLQCRSYWAKYQNRNGITQCFRCQRMGHAARNCNLPHRCVKCAANHPTESCLKTPDTPATCVNCGGAHTANYRQCPIIVKYQESLNIHRNAVPRPLNYIPAPAPATNYWQRQHVPTTNSVAQPYSYNGIQFPPLPQPANFRTSRPPLLPAPAPANIHHQTAPTTTSASKPTSLDTITTLMTEVEELYAICDLDRLLGMVRKLKAALAPCTDDLSRVQAIYRLVLESRTAP